MPTLKKYGLLLFMLLATYCGHAQMLELQSGYIIPTYSKSVMDKDFNTYRVSSNNLVSSPSLVISKFDSNDNPVWVKTISGTGVLFGIVNELVYDIAVDKQDNVVVLAPFTSGSFDVDPSSGTTTLVNQKGRDIFAVKLGPDGNFLWGKTLIADGDTDRRQEDTLAVSYQDNVVYQHRIAFDNDGNIVIAGEFQLPIIFNSATTITSLGKTDIYFAKFTADGDFVMAKQISGTGTNLISAIAVDSENSLIITGAFFDDIDLDPSAAAYVFNGKASSTVDTDAVVFNDTFLARYSPTGDLQWAQHQTGANNVNFYINTDKPGSIYVSNSFRQSVDLGSGHIITGKDGAYIAQYMLDGTLNNVISFKESGTGYYYQLSFGVGGIAFAANGDLVILGEFSGSVTFPPNQVLTGLANPTNFIARFKPDGTFVWATQLYPYTYPALGKGNNIYINAEGLIIINTAAPFYNVPIDPSFITTYDIDPRACVYNLNFNWTNFAYSAKFKEVPIPQITAFSLPQQISPAIIDQQNKIIYIPVAPDADITHLSPQITVNRGTLDVPTGTPRDFTNIVTYNILEDCTQYPYQVSVLQAKAGPDQQLCGTTTAFTLAANSLRAGGKGSWEVVSPAGLNLFDDQNLLAPNYIAKGNAVVQIPKGLNAILRWNVSYPSLNLAFSDEIKLYNYNPPVVEAGQNQLINLGEKANLAATVTGDGTPVTYAWTPTTGLSDAAVFNPVASPLATTTYSVTVTSQTGCQATGSVTVIVTSDLHIPTAFTPNGDGVNDTWNIQNVQGHPGITVRVFNRNGGQVYFSNGYNTSWNGTFNGKKLPAGTYYYLINTGGQKSSPVLSGAITILY